MKQVDEIKELNRKLDILLAVGCVKQTFKVGDIAKLQGVSDGYLRTHPYLLPHFGKPDYEELPLRWTLKSVLDWQAKYSGNPRLAKFEWEEQERKASGGVKA